MMFPLNESGMLSGLACGVLFGIVLENAGFGSPRKLTAQFRLTDWSVFKVMFTAIAVAALGLYLLRHMGLVTDNGIYVPTAMLMAAAIGGTLVGAGFAVGGYCPGTSVVGLCSGRIDALVFLIGLLVGTFVFAGIYGESLEAVMAMGEVSSGDTFADAFGWSEAVIIAVIWIALAAVFRAGAWFERRSIGPMSAEQTLDASTPASF